MMNQGFGYVGQQENGYYQQQTPAAQQWPQSQPSQQLVWGGASNNDAMAQGYSQAPMGDDGQPITTVYVASDNVKRLIGGLTHILFKFSN